MQKIIIRNLKVTSSEIVKMKGKYRYKLGKGIYIYLNTLEDDLLYDIWLINKGIKAVHET